MLHYRIFQYFTEHEATKDDQNKFFRVAIGIEDEQRNRAEIRISINIDESESYRDWFNTHWEIEQQPAGQMGEILKFAAKFDKILNQIDRNPIYIINELENLGIRQVFYTTAKFGFCGYVLTPYFVTDLSKNVITVSNKNGLIIAYVGNEKEYLKKLKMSFNDFSIFGEVEKKSHPINIEDFERSLKLMEKIKNIKTWRDR